MKDYLKIAGNIHLSYYLEAADILGIKYEVIVPMMSARFEYEGVHWFINNTVIPVNNAPSSRLARGKQITSKILNDAGIPVPLQIVAKSEQEAMTFFQEHHDIVLKPSQNLGGKGVSILPRTVEDLRKAYLHARDNDKKGRVLVEEHIKGTDYRILAIGEQVISVVKRLPAHVTGNGSDTIRNLILKENAQRERNMLMHIPVDSETQHVLQSIGLTLESVPNDGEFVQLRKNSNLTTGGTTEECNGAVHPYYKEMAIKALKAIDLEFGGVDLITPDITKEAKCAINEINYNPGLRIHYKLSKGEPQQVAVPILEYVRDKYILRSKEDTQQEVS